MLDVLGKEAGRQRESLQAASLRGSLTQTECQNVIIIPANAYTGQTRTTKYTKWKLLIHGSYFAEQDTQTERRLNGQAFSEASYRPTWRLDFISQLYERKCLLCPVLPKVAPMPTEAISGAVWHWWCWQQSPSHITASAKVRPNERDVEATPVVLPQPDLAAGWLADEA